MKQYPLPDLLASLARKISSLDQNLVLKALISFDEIPQGPIDFIKGNEITIDQIRTLIKQSIRTIRFQ